MFSLCTGRRWTGGLPGVATATPLFPGGAVLVHQTDIDIVLDDLEFEFDVEPTGTARPETDPKSRTVRPDPDAEDDANDTDTYDMAVVFLAALRQPWVHAGGVALCRQCGCDTFVRPWTTLEEGAPPLTVKVPFCSVDCMKRYRWDVVPRSRRHA